MHLQVAPVFPSFEPPLIPERKIFLKGLLYLFPLILLWWYLFLLEAFMCRLRNLTSAHTKLSSEMQKLGKEPIMKLVPVNIPGCNSERLKRDFFKSNSNVMNNYPFELKGD